MNYKDTVLIAAGDSFNFGTSSWSKVLEPYFHRVHNVSVPSGSNPLIRSRIIDLVRNCLDDGLTTDRVLVGVNWTGFFRCFFLDLYKKGDYIDPSVKDYCYPQKYGKSDLFWTNFNIHHQEDPLVNIYYKYFYSPVDAIYKTLDVILSTQNFLDNLGINYFMFTSWNLFKYDYDDWINRARVPTLPSYYNKEVDVNNVNNETYQTRHCFNFLKQDFSYKPLLDSINFTKFIDSEGYWEYTYIVNPNRDKYVDHHPSEEEAKRYALDIIKPHIDKNIIN